MVLREYREKTIILILLIHNISTIRLVKPREYVIHRFHRINLACDICYLPDIEFIIISVLVLGHSNELYIRAFVVPRDVFTENRKTHAYNHVLKNSKCVRISLAGVMRFNSYDYYYNNTCTVC